MPYGGLNKLMDAAPEIGRSSVSKHHVQLDYGDEQADVGRDCRTRLVRSNSQPRTETDYQARAGTDSQARTGIRK